MKNIKLTSLLFFLSIIACTNRDGEIIDLINSVKKQNDDLKAQIAALKKTTDSALVAVLKVSSLQSATDKKIDLIQTDLKSILTQIASLTNQISSNNADLAILKTKIEALQEKCNQLLAQLLLLTSSNITTNVPTVVSKTGRIWMDRNLGATQVATSQTDEKAYGYYYQWGRGNDGHQFPNSQTTSTLSQTDQPGNNLFILVPGIDSGPLSKDWKININSNLWQGVNGVNNVCPNGFRLPTNQEWNQEISTWASPTAQGAFSSVLKLPLNGNRIASFGNISEPGRVGFYWSSSSQNDRGGSMGITFDNASTTYTVRSYGYAVRCIKD